MLGVTDHDEAAVRQFATAWQVNYPIAFAAERDREAFGIEMVWGSTFYLVDPFGRIVESGFEACMETLAERFGPLSTFELVPADA